MKKNILIAVSFVLTGLVVNAQVDRTEPPKPQPNPEININIPDVVTTDNGMKVIVVENHKLPVVSFQLFVDYPIIPEGDKSGLSTIFGELLGSGTASFNKDEFDARVDYMGADIFTNDHGFYASSLKKHTPQLLELLSEVTLKPTFPQEELERIVTLQKSALATQKSDPATMASNVAHIVNYGKNHPYGEIITEETLDNISIADVRSFYEKYFVPNMAYLVVVGDVTQEEALGYVNKYFSAWEKGDQFKQEQFTTPTASGRNVYFVDKPGAVQSQISITHTTKLPPGHPDVLKVRLMNQILGGGSFSAHLMKNLREDKAYTYGCYSNLDSDELVATFSAGGSFRNEVTDSAIVQILYEIEWMLENAVSDDELTLVKNSISGAFGRSLEKSRTLANFALNTARYNLPKDYYTKYLTRLESITKEDIMATAKKYLTPENLNIVVVGNSEVAEKLERFDSNGGMEFRDAYGNEKVNLKPVPEGVTVKTVLNDYVYKRFSASNEDEYKSATKKVGYIQTTYKAFMEAFGAEMFMTSYRGTPNKTASLVKINSAQGNMVAQKEWFNGETGGTFVAMQGKTKYEGEKLEQKKAPNFPIEQYHYTKLPYVKVELLGIDEIDGKEYYKIEVRKEGEEDFSFEYYDVKSGLLAMEETFTTDPEGNIVEGKVTYDDYKDVKKGFLVPHKMTIFQNGQEIVCELVSTEVKKKPKSPAFEGEF